MELMQALGYCFDMSPILKRLYKGEELQKAIKRHLEFYINVIRLAIRWYGIKYGYSKGTDFVQDVAGNKLQKITEGASILGLFVMGALVNKWTHVNIPVFVSEIVNSQGETVITTIQSILDQLMPGLVPLIMTFACMALMKRKVNAKIIILWLFAIGILGYAAGIVSV